jgi:hypothetical protein
VPLLSHESNALEVRKDDDALLVIVNEMIAELMDS